MFIVVSDLRSEDSSQGGAAFGVLRSRFGRGGRPSGAVAGRETGVDADADAKHARHGGMGLVVVLGSGGCGPAGHAGTPGCGAGADAGTGRLASLLTACRLARAEASTMSVAT